MSEKAKALARSLGMLLGMVVVILLLYYPDTVKKGDKAVVTETMVMRKITCGNVVHDVAIPAYAPESEVIEIEKDFCKFVAEGYE